MPGIDKISAAFREHYSSAFNEHGPTPQGVGWNGEDRAKLRYDKMLAVLNTDYATAGRTPSLLDVGCGYGGLLARAQELKIDLNYTGIDVAGNMVSYARENLPDGEFVEGNVLDWQPGKKFDYVVCNGILTKKLSTSDSDMDAFAHRLIRELVQLCSIGAAFNVMSTKVDYTDPELYYKDPSEMMEFCLANLSRYVRLDHGYPLYEYTLYVYTGT